MCSEARRSSTASKRRAWTWAIEADHCGFGDYVVTDGQWLRVRAVGRGPSRFLEGRQKETFDDAFSRGNSEQRHCAGAATVVHDADGRSKCVLLWGGLADGPDETDNSSGEYDPTAVAAVLARCRRNVAMSGIFELTLTRSVDELRAAAGVAPPSCGRCGGATRAREQPGAAWRVLPVDLAAGGSAEPPPTVRYQHSACVVGGDLVVFGGQGVMGTPPQEPALRDTDAEVLRQSRRRATVSCASTAKKAPM